MKCPRTNTPLKTLELGGISVDVAENYGGVFFDNYELKNFDESRDLAGSVLVQYLQERSSNSAIDTSVRIKCPKCLDPVMMRRFYSPQRRLEIDECPACAGIWLDCGELEFLRKIFISNERSDSMFDQILKEDNFSPEIIAGDEILQEAEKQQMSILSLVLKSIFKF